MRADVLDGSSESSISSWRESGAAGVELLAPCRCEDFRVRRRVARIAAGAVRQSFDWNPLRVDLNAFIFFLDTEAARAYDSI